MSTRREVFKAAVVAGALVPLTHITVDAAAEPALPMPQMVGIVARDASGQMHGITFDGATGVVTVHRTAEDAVVTVPLAAAADLLQSVERLLQGVADAPTV